MHKYKLVYEDVVIEYLPERRGVVMSIDGNEDFVSIDDIVGADMAAHPESIGVSFVRSVGQFISLKMGLKATDLEMLALTQYELDKRLDEIVNSTDGVGNTEPAPLAPTVMRRKRDDLN